MFIIHRRAWSLFTAEKKLFAFLTFLFAAPETKCLLNLLDNKLRESDGL